GRLSRGGFFRGPSNSVGADRLIETFESEFTEILEGQYFSFAQLGNNVRHQNLLRLRVRTKACGELDSAAKEIIVMFDRFACGDPDPNLKRAIGFFSAMLGNLALNAGRALHG